MARKGTARKTQKKPLEPVSQKAPRVIGRQAGVGVVPDDFCAEDSEILEMFGIL